MEIALLMKDLMWIFIFTCVVFLVSTLIFRKHHQLIQLIYTLALLILTQYFIIAQRDYIFDKYPKTAYAALGLAILMYFTFIRELISLIKTKKSEKDASSKEIS